MLVKYKTWYDYRLSCGHVNHELIDAKGCTTLCRIHGYRVFIIESIPKEKDIG